MNKRRHRLQMVTLCISATMVLVLLGLVVLSVLTANNLQKSLRENIEISVILGDTVSVKDGTVLGSYIKTKPYAREVVYISSEEALKTAKSEMGIDPTEFAGCNPFSAELTVKLEVDYANTDSLQKIADTLRKNNKVVDAAHLHLLHTDQQLGAAEHLFSTIHHPHHEVGWCLMGIHPQTFPQAGHHRGTDIGNADLHSAGDYHLRTTALHAARSGDYDMARAGVHCRLCLHLRLCDYGAVHLPFGEQIPAHDSR